MKPYYDAGQIAIFCAHSRRVILARGSGTTLLAARLLGRHAVGIEISERYCAPAARPIAHGVLGVIA